MSSIEASSYFYEQVPLTLSFCLEKGAYDFSWSVFVNGRALAAVETTILWLLYFSATYSSKKGKKKPSRIIGNFQRNVITFRQTMIFWTIQPVYQSTQRFLLILLSNHFKSVKPIHLLCDMGWIVTFSMLFQVVVYLNICKNFPTKEPKRPKPRNQEIVPRRDIQIDQPTALGPPVAYFQRSRTIFVKPISS